MAKLAWKILNCTRELWSEVLNSKYGVTGKEGAHYKDKQRSSQVWKGVVLGEWSFSEEN